MGIEYGLSIIYINVIAYLYLNFCFFTALFVFNVGSYKTLNDFKNLGNLPFFTVTFILILFSLAGVPPTLGFVSKSLIFIFMFFKKIFFFLTVLTVLNLFIMYFYVRNVRYFITKSSQYNFLYENNYSFLNWNLVLLLLLFNFFNFLSIFFIEDFLLFMDNIVLYTNFF
jgi:NADH-quinone oxidoreductase subunit N